MAGSGTAHLRTGDPNILLSVQNLVVEFPVARRTKVHAVTDLSFDIAEGETLGIVGESGCGKSTTARAVIQIPKPSSGSVEFNGVDITELSGEELRNIRPDIQMIFQDPISSLNPRRTVFDIVSEGINIWSKSNEDLTEDRVVEIIQAVGLDVEETLTKRPHEYSGGQCQRISIARALILDPKIIICDEPVSALDVSVQARILNMLEDMKSRYGLTLLFISHDLSVVKNVSDRVAVMYLGKLCEIGDGDLLYEEPAHPYTRLLLAAIPDPNNKHSGNQDILEGELPSPINPPSGCRFRTRCPRATEKCAAEEPQISQINDRDHWVACHFPHLDAKGANSSDEILWPPE
ncbi:MAG: ATP-binding cassette domain-containing protein [Acidimicrobiales bacterium]|jgi:peptide/nickel transport system ATP-binding protein|nr:ATP-binding cassette domain-containing protein [Acidimicrobiales bacterium]MDP6298255.1 ATP-binding cassette domain-containing protein [Acidimicrobiales bacterium]HJM29021.1 oligopeptide/dipeptide ABC transporter ATP-binding protein [Acidimicrobiales bacterium]